MRINSIKNTPYFGYNKELNEKVNYKLQNTKGNKDAAQTLLSMNILAMSAEDKLRKAEKQGNKKVAEMLRGYFIQMKLAATSEINARFPQLNYRNKELQTYQKELKKQPDSKKKEYTWLMEIIDNLALEEDLKITILNDLNAEETADKNSSEIEKVYFDDSIDTDNINTEKSDKTSKKSKTKENEGSEFVELFVPTPDIPKNFSELGGMESEKDILWDKIIDPIKNPEQAELDRIEYGKKFPRGVLFYGPPGCGKTSIVSALAQEVGLPMYKAKTSKSGSIYVNGSSIQIQQGYDFVKNIAKKTGKPVLFMIDEMESLASKRKSGENSEDNKVVDTLLQIIEDARGNNVLIFGATNHINAIDEAIASRIDYKSYVGLPKDDTRRAVLKIALSKLPKGHALRDNEEELEKVVKATKGFSNRDIAILTEKVSDIARRDGRRDISANDFIDVCEKNQNMKVKEDLYMDKSTRPTIGF